MEVIHTKNKTEFILYVYILFYILANTKFYGCVVTRKDYLERIEDGGYDREEYEHYPSKYKSSFNKKVRFIS